MKNLIITSIAALMMVGSVSAQDNKVRIQKVNVESIQRADSAKVCKMKCQSCRKLKIEKDATLQLDTTKQAFQVNRKVKEGKSLKLDKVEAFPREPQKRKPIKANK